MVIAVLDSVTVSIAALSRGILVDVNPRKGLRPVTGVGDLFALEV